MPRQLPPSPSTVTIARPVLPRTDSTIDPRMVRVAADVARKRNAFPGYFGYAVEASDLRTHLRVVAWVRNVALEKSVWLDVHLFDRGGDLLRSETLALRYDQATRDGGDLFVLDAVLLPGASATQVLTVPRPDARALQYRLYAQQSGQTFTDGLAHWRELRMDSSGD